jgi:hypothetical protein
MNAIYFSRFHIFFYFLLPPLGGLLPFWSIGQIYQFLDKFTNGRTPWTGDQLVARPLPKHKTTQTEKKAYTHQTSLSGIRTHDPGLWASEDRTCLRQLGYRDRLDSIHLMLIFADVFVNEFPTKYGEFMVECLITICFVLNYISRAPYILYEN